MDWSAVALLLAERAELPVVLLSEDGKVVHVAPAAQKALGCPLDIIGQNWVERHGSGEAAQKAQATLTKALTGATHRVDVSIRGAQGLNVATFESHPIGHAAPRGLLLFLLQVTPATEGGFVKDFDYEVEDGRNGDIELRSLQRWGQPPSAAEGSCFQVLYGQTSPCERCPVRAPSSAADVNASVLRCEAGEWELATASLLKPGNWHVSVRRLSKTAFSAMLQARLEELAVRAGLSGREREVLGLLVDGRSFEEIGETLGITPCTVKYHQAKLLAKLGADSRSDLMRLLF